jgi:hypothetical protein
MVLKTRKILKLRIVIRGIERRKKRVKDGAERLL